MKKLITYILLLLPLASQAQTIGNYLGDESLMYAETKQVNQFLRRFNNEEDKAGNKYSPNSQEYRSNEMRPQYIRLLFDAQNPSISAATKEAFIKDVTAPNNTKYLEFHNGDWFAEVVAEFKWKGRPAKANLFLKLEKDGPGYKWVISGCYFEEFSRLFQKNNDGVSKFLHPMSHELDFMNLIKVFNDKGHLTDYAEKDFQPDYLTLLIYELKQNNLKFETISKVNFHFFQIDGWYFELSEFNRASYNSGWLISSMTKLAPNDKKILLDYIINKE
ncbi:hypothetical protein V6R21_17180 [Limibacter armeniacum]|uniref:hypothetical protein n=1 Tax=Limibacter armeniacum TaxID=466084 RepID=UPI002FE559D2